MCSCARPVPPIKGDGGRPPKGEVGMRTWHSPARPTGQGGGASNTRVLRVGHMRLCTTLSKDPDDELMYAAGDPCSIPTLQGYWSA